MADRRRLARGAIIALGVAVLGLAVRTWVRQRPRVIGAPCAASRPPPAHAPNILLITVDTLRPDRLGAYGHVAAHTPAIDALARAGVRFDQATTPSPRTTPAIGSLFTGLWPHHHGSREIGQPLGPAQTLASALCEAGYTTLGVTANKAAGPSQNVHVGFERLVWNVDAGARVTAEAIALVEQAGSAGPMFLWTHYFDPHTVYLPPNGWPQPEAPHCRALMAALGNPSERGGIYSDAHGRSSQALAECAALYDAEISYTDAQIGELVARLKRGRRMLDPIVILTSDHGENLGEAGLYYEHGPSVHDASLRIPLVVSGPGLLSGTVDSGVARLEDLMPTLLSLVGVAPPDRPAMDGMDISARLRADASQVDFGEPGPGFAVAESGGALYWTMVGHLRSGSSDGVQCLNGPRFSLCSGRFGRERLYDRVADPELATDVASRHPEALARLRAAALVWPVGVPRERTVRTPRYKLVESPLLEGGYRRALYDLQADPRETRDVSAELPGVLAELRAQLDQWTSELPTFEARASTPEQLEILRSLGYVE